ncbi:uncharacterized protein [Glycine max]|uniref:uncharacterized protein n=1 Tax=Glycine max TaxID=3847 RepID=UPI0003DE8DCE|nr:uncharacterized protein LOC100806726 [Glycine max]|eukprot:XP_006598646.1 uncharacterized protein LOC100806726 [Glycine max]
MKLVESQLTNIQSLWSQRQLGNLPSEFDQTLRENAKVVMTRSKKVQEDFEEKEDSSLKAANDILTVKNRALEKVEVPTYRNSMPKKERDKKKEILTSLQVSLTFPHIVKSDQRDVQFKKSLKVMRKLHINLHFVEAILQMSSYAKHLKEILSNKEKLENFGTVGFNDECSAMVIRKLPPTMKDLDKFIIPCLIEGFYFDKCLCDLGGGINLMPYPVFKKLGITDLEPTNIFIHLVDLSVVYSREAIEDVLVKVDKFIFSIDFVILDLEADEDAPIILQRPFLSTRDLLVDVRLGRLTLILGGAKVVFNLSDT